MLVKIADIRVPCNHPEHNPPAYMLLSPGIYRHICPSCGKVTEFSVPVILNTAICWDKNVEALSKYSPS